MVRTIPKYDVDAITGRLSDRRVASRTVQVLAVSTARGERVRPLAGPTPNGDPPSVMLWGDEERVTR